MLERISRFSRSLLVVGTIATSIFGSRVATEPQALPDWLWTLGGGFMIIFADMLAADSADVRVLSRATNVDKTQAWTDMVTPARRRALIGVFALVIAMTALAVAAQAMEFELSKDLPLVQKGN